MPFRAGTTTALYLGTATLTNASPYLDSTSLSQDTAMLDVTAFGTADSTFIPGLNSAQISVSGPHDATIAGVLRGARAAGSLLGFVFGPGGSVAGNARSAGSVWVSNFTDNSAVGSRVDWSASLQVSGAVQNSTF